jgi:glycosyltransferase involved in cell wall biosynthesis
VDLRTFHPPLPSDDGTAARAKLNLPANAPVILHVGRLDTDKSVDIVIRAAAQPIRESEAHLLIVGDGRQKNHLIRLCRELRIEKRVHFTGYVRPSDLPEIYRLANVFVTASEIETQGIVLLEAAASGLPIVAVKATCIPEIVHDHCNGFLINPGDIGAFGEAIHTLLTDPEWAHAMGREGCRIAEGHDIQNTWALHEKLYLEMAANPSPPYNRNWALPFIPVKTRPPAL